MNNSDKVKIKLNIARIVCLLITALLIYIFTCYIIVGLIPFFDKLIIFIIYFFIVLSILTCSFYYIINLNRIDATEMKKVYLELDNDIEKIFRDFGVYITKNYIVYLGSKFDLVRLFVIHIKEIDAIDTHRDSRYFYKKRGEKSKNKLLSFVVSSVKDKMVFGDNDLLVLNIICGKKVYCITTSSSLNKKKIKKMNEIADYICDKYKNIDYI